MTYELGKDYEPDEQIKGTYLNEVYNITGLKEVDRERKHINSKTLISQAIPGITLSDILDVVYLNYLGNAREGYIKVINFFKESFGIDFTACPPKQKPEFSDKLTFENLAKGLEELVKESKKE